MFGVVTFDVHRDFNQYRISPLGAGELKILMLNQYAQGEVRDHVLAEDMKAIVSLLHLRIEDVFGQKNLGKFSVEY